MGLQLICAIMSHPAFHFEPRTSRYASVALIIISASLPFPCPVSLSCSQSQPRPGCRSPRTWRWNAYLRRLQMRIGNYLRFNTIFQIKTEDLNEILHCYLSGVELVTRVCWSDRLITQTTYFLLSTHHRWHLPACVHNVQMLQWLVACICHQSILQLFNQTCLCCSVMQRGIQRIDYNPQDNPCILLVMCIQQRHRLQTCKLWWLSVFTR